MHPLPTEALRNTRACGVRRYVRPASDMMSQERDIIQRAKEEVLPSGYLWQQACQQTQKASVLSATDARVGSKGGTAWQTKQGQAGSQGWERLAARAGTGWQQERKAAGGDPTWPWRARAPRARRQWRRRRRRRTPGPARCPALGGLPRAALPAGVPHRANPGRAGAWDRSSGSAPGLRPREMQEVGTPAGCRAGSNAGRRRALTGVLERQVRWRCACGAGGAGCGDVFPAVPRRVPPRGRLRQGRAQASGGTPSGLRAGPLPPAPGTVRCRMATRPGWARCRGGCRRLRRGRLPPASGALTGGSGLRGRCSAVHPLPEGRLGGPSAGGDPPPPRPPHAAAPSQPAQLVAFSDEALPHQSAAAHPCHPQHFLPDPRNEILQRLSSRSSGWHIYMHWLQI